MKQYSFFDEDQFSECHGGGGQKKKIARPLSTKKPMHFVLKADVNLYERKGLVERELFCQAKLAGIRIYDHAVARDHLHFVARMVSRILYRRFIRALTGILARRLGTKLWALLPFSRIASWGREFLILRGYMEQNREEAAGRRKYNPRKDRYKKYRTG